MRDFINKYPYTDFHELNLDWILDTIKKLVQEWSDIQSAWEDEQQAFQDLHDYVMNYFDNLDVQEEINNKLNQMAADGTLDALLLPYFNRYKTEINNIVAGQNQTIDNQNGRITVLENRMDSFAHLNEGSTTGDAELMDIRVPAAGFHGNVTYASAGDAVRGQVTELDTFVNNIKDSENYIKDGSTSWDYGLYNLYSGAEQASASWRRTPKFGYCTLPLIDFGNVSLSLVTNVFISFWKGDTYIGSYDYINNIYYDTAYTPTTAFTEYDKIAFMIQTDLAISYLETISFLSLNYLKSYSDNYNNALLDAIQEDTDIFEWESGLYSVTTGAAQANAVWYRSKKHYNDFLPAITDTSCLMNYDLIACLWYDSLFVGSYNYTDQKYRDNTYTIVNAPIKFNTWAIDIHSIYPLVSLDSLLNRTTAMTSENMFKHVFRNNRVRQKIGSPANLKIGFIGDSLTTGIIGPGPEQGIPFAKYLADMTGNSNYALLASPGGTAQYIYNNWVSVVDVSSYNLFVIMLGTNGYLEGDFQIAKDDPNTQIWAYCQIIEKLLSDTQGQCKILLLNPPDSDDPARTTAIKNHIHINTEKIADYYGLPCLDLKYASLLDPSDATLYNQVDKVHLTNKGYEIVAEMIYDFLIDNFATMTSAKQYTIV